MPGKATRVSHSLGDLVDRLSITNAKLFAVQDLIHQAAKTKRGLDADTTAKLVSLNLERNRLMSDIDRCLNEAVKSGGALIDARVKIT